MPRYGPRVPVPVLLVSPAHHAAQIQIDQLLNMSSAKLQAFIKDGQYPEALMCILGMRNYGYSAFGEAIRIVAKNKSKKGKIWQKYGERIFMAHGRLHYCIKVEEREKYGLEGWEYQYFAIHKKEENVQQEDVRVEGSEDAMEVEMSEGDEDVEMEDSEGSLVVEMSDGDMV